MTAQNKQHVFMTLRGTGAVTIHLDARYPGVVLPDHLLSEYHVTLIYGLPEHLPALPDSEALEAALFFGETSQPTVIPWGAIFYMTNELNSAFGWIGSVPPEVIQATLMELKGQHHNSGKPPNKPEQKTSPGIKITIMDGGTKERTFHPVKDHLKLAGDGHE